MSDDIIIIKFIEEIHTYYAAYNNSQNDRYTIKDAVESLYTIETQRDARTADEVHNARLGERERDYDVKNEW